MITDKTIVATDCAKEAYMREPGEWTARAYIDCLEVLVQELMRAVVQANGYTKEELEEEPIRH